LENLNGRGQKTLAHVFPTLARIGRLDLSPLKRCRNRYDPQVHPFNGGQTDNSRVSEKGNKLYCTVADSYLQYVLSNNVSGYPSSLENLNGRGQQTLEHVFLTLARIGRLDLSTLRDAGLVTTHKYTLSTAAKLIINAFQTRATNCTARLN